jgi:peptide/nickel transport system permease protein
LLILPTVWLIGSVIFLLSRIIPGSYADLLAEAEQTAIGGAGLSLNRTSYLKKLADSGKDKPLFYFSVKTRAQPDTLNRVFPVRHQKLLQTLLNRYGNWPAVAAYYQSLLVLQNTPTHQLTSDSADSFPADAAGLLLQTANSKEISYLLQALPATNLGASGAAARVQEQFTQMEQQAQPLNLLIPSLRWHGLHNQYHQWLIGLVAGEMGKSDRTRQPVMEVIGEAIGNTLLLLTGSLILTFVLGIQLALALCRWRYGRKVVLNILYILDSTPLFIIALLLLTFLASSGYLKIFPGYGLGKSYDSSAGLLPFILNRLYHLLLPALCLIISGVPYVTTQLYQVLQQVLSAQYIMAARAKGLTETRVLRQHAFRNALLPLITAFTGFLPAIISGAVVIEVIFAIPGTGRLLVDSVLSRDYPVIIGLVLFIAALRAVSHVLADFLYFAADPRTRLKTA